MRAPSTQDLPEPLRGAATGIARRLAELGRRAWLVGGAVRDLALGRSPKDADLASAARPEEVEAAFERTAAVGRAFGTVLVLDFGVEVQVTTFRAESGYADARHPDDVRYADTPEEDARRRDFTCNALYLDPLTDEVRDPAGGLADLAAGRLRCVGDAEERFREDGLRLLRLARFCASLGLAVEPGTRAAAARALDALRGVSAERVYAELARIATGPDPARALVLLDEIGALSRVLTGWEDAAAERRPALAALAPQAGLAPWLAALTGAAPAALEALRAPRAVAQEVGEVAAGAAALAEPAPPSGADALRLVRRATWPGTLALARARGGAVAQRADELEALRAERVADLRPAPLLTGADLRAAGVPEGPRLGELLRELETRQLEGELRTRDDALAWLARTALDA
jgi:tRNA nucleotidyltransferase/poly(A) polymerase